METILIVVACLAVVAVYVAWCRRRDRRADKEHQAVMTAMSPGPKIRELTTVRSNPMRARRLAGGSRPVVPVTTTDFETYTPVEIDTVIHVRADTDSSHHHATCIEAPVHDAGQHVPHHDACSIVDTPYGGFDGSSHHGH